MIIFKEHQATFPFFLSVHRFESLPIFYYYRTSRFVPSVSVGIHFENSFAAESVDPMVVEPALDFSAW